MTRTEIETIIQAYRAAELSVLAGKTITFNGQQMTMENLSEIRAGLLHFFRHDPAFFQHISAQ